MTDERLSGLPDLVRKLGNDAIQRGWEVSVMGDDFEITCDCGDEHFYGLHPVDEGTYRDNNARDYLQTHTCWGGRP